MGKCGTQRGRTTTKWSGSLKDGGHRRRDSTGWEEWEGGGTLDGVRTEAGGWFDPSHVCVQPRLFAASWMSMKRRLPLPPGPFCLGPGRCALSRPAEFPHDVSFLQAVQMLSTPEVAILKVPCMFRLRISSSFPSLGTGRWKARRHWGEIWRTSAVPLLGRNVDR